MTEPLGATWPRWPMKEFFLVAGPCVLEDDAVHAAVAAELRRIRTLLGIPVLFKASFDKANRAMPGSLRGPGLFAGLPMLRRIREDFELPILTDVHETQQVAEAAAVCDALQIPAFLHRQTDLLRAAGATGLPVNVKKGQWVSPGSMMGAVAKIRAAGGRDVAVTERGTFFGYGDLVVDMRTIPHLQSLLPGGGPVLFDATHSLQRPGMGGGGASGGDVRWMLPLVRAAIAAGADGLFVETHPDPKRAPSDGGVACPLDALCKLAESALGVYFAVRAL